MRDAYGRGIFKLLVKRPVGFKMFGCGFGRWGARWAETQGESALVVKFRVHSGNSDLTTAIAAWACFRELWERKEEAMLWGVVEDLKWLTYGFELYAPGNEELRSLVNVGEVWWRQYSRETDQGRVQKMAAVQVWGGEELPGHGWWSGEDVGE